MDISMEMKKFDWFDNTDSPPLSIISRKTIVHLYNNAWAYEKVFGFNLVYYANDAIHLSIFSDMEYSLHGLVQIG